MNYSPTIEAQPAEVDTDELGDKAQHMPLIGTVDLRQSLAARVGVGLVAAVILSLVLGLWFGRFARTEPVRGIVAATGGFSRLDAPRNGTIVAIYVKQGDHVVPGQRIYALKSGAASSGGETAVAEQIQNYRRVIETETAHIARIDRFLSEAKAQQRAIDSEQSNLLRELKSQEAGLVTAVADNKQTVQRIAGYLKQGFATRDWFDTHQRTLFDYEKMLSDLKMRRAEVEREQIERQRTFDQMVADKTTERNNAQTQIINMQNQIADSKTVSDLEVQSQTRGTVVAVASRVGDSVTQGQFVVGIGDVSAKPLVVVDAPTRAIGLTKVGQRVILKYDAFPFKTFGIYHGTITYISSAAVKGVKSDDDGLDPRPVELQSTYRIEIKPDQDFVTAYGEKYPLKLGSTLSADIVVERRRLIDWVLDPIRALRGRT